MNEEQIVFIAVFAIFFMVAILLMAAIIDNLRAQDHLKRQLTDLGHLKGN